MKGGLGFTGQSPSAAWRSVWQTPEARIATWIMPGPGSGTGTSSIIRGLPNIRTTAAFIVLAMAGTSIWKRFGASDLGPVSPAWPTMGRHGGEALIQRNA